MEFEFEFEGSNYQGCPYYDSSKSSNSRSGEKLRVTLMAAHVQSTLGVVIAYPSGRRGQVRVGVFMRRQTCR